MRSLRSAVAGCDAKHAANDMAERLVEVDALDAPRVLDAAPAHSPGPDPAGERFLEFERARDKRIVRGRLRWEQRELSHTDAPGGEVGVGRKAHLHTEVVGYVGEGSALQRTRRIFGA